MTIQHLLYRASMSPEIRRLLRLLKIHVVGNVWLRHFPRVRMLPDSGVTYRVVSLESIPLAHEIFTTEGLYDAALLPSGFTTFADLGCNVGYFTCWLTHLSQGRALKGLLVDANPAAVAEARWHIDANKMIGVDVVQGLLGSSDNMTKAEFYVYESSVCSTSKISDTAKEAKCKGKWTSISVPCISFEAEWKRRFGNTRCNLMKLDIEGSELDFLKAESSFLALVDSLYVEWHKWRVDFIDLENILGAHGFRLVKVLEETGTMGTAFFLRS